MATIIHPNGNNEKVEPANGSDFTLAELNKIVGGYIEIVRLPFGDDLILVINEEGKLKGLPVNRAATVLYGNPNDHIVGTVLLCRTEQVK